MAKNKIVVTGGAGFIGSNLIQLLSETYPKNYEIISIDRRKNQGICTKSKNVIYYQTDINQWLPTLHNVEAVIHLAALPGVRSAENTATQVIFDNILASQKIIHECIKSWRPKKLLIASSSSVYDGRIDGPMNEIDTPIRPLSLYGVSKLAVEQMTKTYMDNGRLKGIYPVNMRIFTVYGPRQRDELAIQKAIDCCLKDEVFTLYGDGTQRRDFTYITDTCSAIKNLMDTDFLHKLEHNIYNIGTGRNISINEVLMKISGYLQKPIKIKYEPATIYDTMYTKASRYLIEHDTGWEACMDFDVGLRKQIEWQKNGIIREKGG